MPRVVCPQRVPAFRAEWLHAYRLQHLGFGIIKEKRQLLHLPIGVFP